MQHLAAFGRDLAHRVDEDLGAMPVVAEHVQAGAGRRQQHRVARSAPARSTRRWLPAGCRGAAAARRCRQARLRSCRHRGRSAPPHARSAPPARPAGRSPGPCRRRRGSAPACPAHVRHPGLPARPRWRRRWCPCCRRRPRPRRSSPPTRRGAPRRGSHAAHAASAPAAARWQRPAPARPAHWRRCGGRGCAAHRPASAAAAGSRALRPCAA